MQIENCSMDDVETILSLYEAARKLQTQNKVVIWPLFEESLIKQEIQEGRQWKIVVDGAIGCVWAVAFEDKQIWEDKDKGDAIYIHRIATNPSLRGNRYVDAIVAWAKAYAKQMGKQYVRLDTLGNNTGLIKHYTSAGFTFLGIFVLTNTAGLPGHYQQERNCCLFELEATK